MAENKNIVTITGALKRLRDELLAWSAANFDKKLNKQFVNENNKVLETDSNGNIITAEKLNIAEDDKETFKIADEEGNIAFEIKSDGTTYTGDLVIKKVFSNSSMQEINIINTLNEKVDKVNGFDLSQNNFTNEEKEKLTVINKTFNDTVEILSQGAVAMQITQEEVSTNRLKANELLIGGYKVTQNKNGLVWVWEGE